MLGVLLLGTSLDTSNGVGVSDHGDPAADGGPLRRYVQVPHLEALNSITLSMMKVGHRTFF